MNRVLWLFSGNRITRLHQNSFQPLPLKRSLKYIDLGFNLIYHMSKSVFHDMSSLETLRLNGNLLQDISLRAFSGLKLLHTLDLGDNQLSEVLGDTFVDLTNLRILSLRSNVITYIDGATFSHNRQLTHLYLQDNRISHIKDDLFRALSSLKVLYLNNNQIKSLTPLTFHGLRKLQVLHLQQNTLEESSISQKVFKDLTDLRELKVDNFILCCYAKKAIKNLACESVDKNKFSSCEDMMKYPSIRACLWLLGILAFCGNLAVLIWRIVIPYRNRVQSILLSNLAMADFLMGLYMLILAILDTTWKGEYFKHDVPWRNSLGCRIAGAISMLSSEVSVAMLTITTADRLICVVFALKFERLTVKSTYIVCACTWVVGIIISILPIMEIEYFDDTSSKFGFFSRSTVCLPLQLSRDKLAGWEYAVAIFIILNLCSFVFILISYIAIYVTMVKIVGTSASSHMQQESAKVNRLFVIVLTDLCCWMPVIIMGILSLTGDFDDLQGLVYVWVAVFVLPVNSSVNPILYTLSTSYVKERIGNVCSSIFIWRKPARVSPNIEMNQLPSNQNTKETDENTRPASIGAKQHHLTLIEVPSIFQDESSDNTGYVICSEEGTNGPTMRLVKWFSQEKEEYWEREVSVHLKMSQRGGHAGVLPYVWHSKVESCTQIAKHDADPPSLPSRGWLICFQFVSGTTLDTLLKDESFTLDAKLLYQLTTDMLQALQFISSCGIQHNNVNMKNILIKKSDEEIPTYRAILGGFGGAADGNLVCFKDNDMTQFSQLCFAMTSKCERQ